MIITLNYNIEGGPLPGHLFFIFQQALDGNRKTHRRVPAKTEQAVPTAQSAVYCTGTCHK